VWRAANEKLHAACCAAGISLGVVTEHMTPAAPIPDALMATALSSDELFLSSSSSSSSAPSTLAASAWVQLSRRAAQAEQVCWAHSLHISICECISKFPKQYFSIFSFLV
jgi:hypothetical protein